MSVKSTKIIDVVPYDPEWPEQFNREAHHIKKALGNNLIELHHVGSTAVPGLAAKPIIDIIVTVSRPEESIILLEALGYTYKGEYTIPFRYFFNKKSGTTRVNLHLYQEGHPEVELNLTFRDYLRTHPEAVGTYAQLKQKLLSQGRTFEKHPSGLTDYTLGKNAFVREVLAHMGFNRTRMTQVTHYHEWEAAKKFRLTHFLRDDLSSDPFAETLTRAEFIHLALHQGVDVVGYMQIELLPKEKAVVHIVELDTAHAYLKDQFLSQCKEWLKKKGYDLS